MHAPRSIATGLILAFLLSFGPAISNSFARFAYALVLPAMRDDLGMSYSQAGWLNTANALGYLAGAVATRVLVARRGNRTLFCVGLFVTAAGILASGLTRDLDWLAFARFVAGIGGAAVFICGGALSANILPERPSMATTTIAIYFAGGGVGLVISGAFVPLLLEQRGISAWPLAWQTMGVISLLMGLASWWAADRIDEPGRRDDRVAVQSTSDRQRTAAGYRPGVSPTRSSTWQFAPAMIAYLLFGLGYIGYMTFVIAWMREAGAPATLVVPVWTMLGAATIVAPLVWRRAFETWPGGYPMAAAIGVLALGAALPFAGSSQASMIASAALFGVAMFSVPSAVTSLIKRSLAKPEWGAAMAIFTVIFAGGQTIGPLIAGWLADRSGSLASGLAGSVAVLVAGSLIALMQSDSIAD